MKKNLTFRELEHTEGLENYINKKLEKIEKFLTHEKEPISLHFILEPHRTHAHHKAELIIKSSHYHVISHYEGPADMYQAINHVIHVAYDQLHKDKQRRIDDRKKGLLPKDI